MRFGIDGYNRETIMADLDFSVLNEPADNDK